MSLERMYLRPLQYYEDQNITLRLSTHVDAIDAEASNIRIGDETLSYDALVLTTGSAPRRLPEAMGGELEGVYCVRDLADVDAMAPEFVEGRHVLIVGGGYIGLEAAAVAAKKGLKVTLIEMADRILQRVAAPETSDYFRALHQSHGVDIRETTALERLEGDGRVAAAVLGDGTRMDVDFVIVGVGIVPETKLAESAGLTIDNGIATDAQGKTSIPNIWAAGDCTSFPHKGGRIRLESVPNAIEQADAVAENICGGGKDYVAKPWFWSDQYDVKLQIAGLNTGYDRVVTRTNGSATSFWYYADQTLLAVDAMNDARGFMIAKRLLEAGKSPAPEDVSDASIDLKSLLRA
jgi:3-phenylpropionate/trans-cinnamate dioxygenase ferredoxin reductase subunit